MFTERGINGKRLRILSLQAGRFHLNVRKNFLVVTAAYQESEMPYKTESCPSLEVFKES